ncbi:EamA-like transporter family protein [uncultured archaeon]|nr:EamA-like transporter family protein [uncultured archaeon]
MNLIPNRNTFEGYGEIITAAILWGFVGILAKKISGMWVPGIIFYRMGLALVILFMVLLISGNLDKIKLKEKKKYLLLFGLLQLATMLAYFVSILNTSVSVAVLLLYTAPVYVTVLSPLLLKENSTKKGVIALILAIAGVVLIVDPEKLDFTRSIGILAGIAAGLSYAFQIITSKYISDTYTGYSQAFWSFFVATFILLPWGLAPTNVVIDNMPFLLLLAIFPTILSISLYFNGLKKVRAQNASILGLIEPASAVFLAMLILGEKISIPVIAGGALILAAAALVTRD